MEKAEREWKDKLETLPYNNSNKPIYKPYAFPSNNPLLSRTPKNTSIIYQIFLKYKDNPKELDRQLNHNKHINSSYHSRNPLIKKRKQRLRKLRYYYKHRQQILTQYKLNKLNKPNKKQKPSNKNFKLTIPFYVKFKKKGLEKDKRLIKVDDLYNIEKLTFKPKYARILEKLSEHELRELVKQQLHALKHLIEDYTVEYVWINFLYETFWLYHVNLINYKKGKFHKRKELVFAYFPFIDRKRLYYCETYHLHGRPRKPRKYNTVKRKGIFQLHIRGFCSRLSRWLGMRLYNGFLYRRLKFYQNGKEHLVIFDRSGLDVCHARCLDMLIKQKLEEYKERKVNPLNISLYHSLPKR